MNKILIALLCVFAVAACGRDDKISILQCGGYDIHMEMLDDGNTMHANINGDELDMVIAPSASGAKYAGILNDTAVVLWNKGDEWTMFLDDEQIGQCKVK